MCLPDLEFLNLLPKAHLFYLFSLIHWPKMKTLQFISLNNCFVSIHVVVRFTHAYRDFVADNDYAFFSNPRSIQASTPEKHVPYVARAEEQVVH